MKYLLIAITAIALTGCLEDAVAPTDTTELEARIAVLEAEDPTKVSVVDTVIVASDTVVIYNNTTDTVYSNTSTVDTVYINSGSGEAYDHSLMIESIDQLEQDADTVDQFLVQLDSDLGGAFEMVYDSLALVSNNVSMKGIFDTDDFELNDSGMYTWTKYFPNEICDISFPTGKANIYFNYLTWESATQYMSLPGAQLVMDGLYSEYLTFSFTDGGCSVRMIVENKFNFVAEFYSWMIITIQ